jgi:hypothetical protein
MNPATEILTVLIYTTEHTSDVTLLKQCFDFHFDGIPSPEIKFQDTEARPTISVNINFEQRKNT